MVVRRLVRFNACRRAPPTGPAPRRPRASTAGIRRERDPVVSRSPSSTRRALAGAAECGSFSPRPCVRVGASRRATALPTSARAARSGGSTGGGIRGSPRAGDGGSAPAPASWPVWHRSTWRARHPARCAHPRVLGRIREQRPATLEGGAWVVPRLPAQVWTETTRHPEPAAGPAGGHDKVRAALGADRRGIPGRGPAARRHRHRRHDAGGDRARPGFRRPDGPLWRGLRAGAG